MNLLVLSLWWPFPPDNGSRLRAYHLIQELARQGHRLRVIAGVQPDAEEVAKGEIPETFRALGVSVTPVPWVWFDAAKGGKAAALRALLSDVPRSVRETPNPALTAAIQAALQEPTDAVLAMQIGMDAYLPEIPDSVPVVLEEVELSVAEHAYRRAQTPKDRLRTGLTYAKSVRYWKRRLQRYDLLTTVSTSEAEAVRRIVGPKPEITVVPNGVDIAAFPGETPSWRRPGQLLYNGAITYAPNREAVHWFAEEILPLVRQAVPNAKLVVTGKYTPELAGSLLARPDIEFTGFLPELQTILAESQAAVVPLLAGGGTRLKILECFAAHLPVVATTIGAVGIEAESGTQLLLADDASSFAEATVRLLTEETFAGELAANARRHAESHFDWRIIGERLSHTLLALRERLSHSS